MLFFQRLLPAIVSLFDLILFSSYMRNLDISFLEIYEEYQKT